MKNSRLVPQEWERWPVIFHCFEVVHRIDFIWRGKEYAPQEMMMLDFERQMGVRQITKKEKGRLCLPYRML